MNDLEQIEENFGNLYGTVPYGTKLCSKSIHKYIFLTCKVWYGTGVRYVSLEFVIFTTSTMTLWYRTVPNRYRTVP